MSGGSVIHKDYCHIFRQWCFKLHRFPGNGVAEAQPVRVERLAGDELHVGIVEVISDEGMTDIFHMNTDLMGAACLKNE